MLNKISNIIEEYNTAGETAPIGTLLKWQDRLCGYSYHLAEASAKATKNSNMKYYNRKIGQISQFNKLKSDIENKITDKLAENKSIESVKEEMREEVEANYTADRYKLILNQLNRTLSAIQQRISQLKKEWEISIKKD